MSEIGRDAPSLREPVEVSVPSILRRAANLIEPPGRWIKGDLARDARRHVVGVKDNTATCWCVAGAIARVSPKGFSDPAYTVAVEFLYRVVGVEITTFNDRRATQAQVVAALRAAADQAEQVSA